MNRYRWILLIVLLIGAFVGYRQLPTLTALWSDNTSVVNDRIPVKLDRVKRGTVNHLLESSGNIEPLTRVDVISPIPGRVQEIRYKTNDLVAPGQIVAVVRSEELLQRIENEESNLKAARSVLSERERQLFSAKEQLENARRFRQQDFISALELQHAESAAETARARHEVAQAQLAEREAALAQARYLLRLGRLVAPFSGVVVRRALEPGATVSSSTVIVTLAGVDSLKIVVDLTDNDGSLVREGMTTQIRVDDFPGRLFDGKVVGIDSTAGPKVEVHLPNRNRLLRPGMATHVSFVVASNEALLVPTQAVMQQGGKNYIYVVVDGRAMRKVVTTGSKQEGNVAIIEGVAEGQLIVVSGHERLRPNSKIRVLEEK